jgi:D-alanyl-D-alanine carboxypeptidase
MQAQFLRICRHALAFTVMLCAGFIGAGAQAAPYAAMVMDARNGEVIFARNHDTRLHPASLTKMMTLYVAFEAVKHGEVTLDTQFTVSARAAGTSCVCLGLRPGQRIALRYLIRAAALRSANDASVVIAEGISGSVEAFADRMTRTARAMGMSNTTFHNPHGLTQAGHLSSARDMTILGRQLYFDYPQYFNIFSRRSDHAGVATVPNTNRRFLDAYSGADGIKTGFTRAAGFNLTASARRGDKHIIATMFGGSSTAARNAHVAELLDIGFSRASARVATRAPATPAYQGRGAVAVAQAPAATRNGDEDRSAAAKTIRLQMAVRSSPRPAARPMRAPDPAVLLAVRESVDAVVSEIAAAQPPAPAPVAELATVAPQPVMDAPPARPESLAVADAPQTELDVALAAGFRLADPEFLEGTEAATDASPEADALTLTEASPIPEARPEGLAEAVAETQMAEPDADPGADTLIALAEAPLPQASGADEMRDDPDALTWLGAEASFFDDGPEPIEDMTAHADLDIGAGAIPAAVQSGIILTSSTRNLETQAIAAALEAQIDSQPQGAAPEIVPRLSTSDGGRLWGVSLGQFNSRAAAERSLITVKMAEANSLGNGVSRIRQTSGRFEAAFAGLTQTEAERACLRLQARSMECAVAYP